MTRPKTLSNILTATTRRRTTISFQHGVEAILSTPTTTIPLPFPCPPLPLPHPPTLPSHRYFNYTNYNTSPLLPHPSRPRPLQTPLPLTRYFSSTSESDSDSDTTPRSASNNSDDRSDKEVDRICTVINNLFAASDRNMEAVLTESRFTLTSCIVVSVLERFRHAHKPATRFFRWAENGTNACYVHDSEAYCKYLSILGKTRQFESMITVIHEMGEKKLLCLDAFKIAIKAFAAGKNYKKSVGVFEMMKKYGFDSGLESFNCLLEMLAKNKLGREAQELFERMKGVYAPDLRTYTVLLLGWARVRNLVELGRVWNEMLDRGLKPDVVAHNTMLEGLIRSQRRPEAVKLFELMKAKGPEPNAFTYTMMIQDHCKGGKMDLAMRVFKDMQSAGCKPNVATYTCLIIGFGNASQMDRISGLLNEMTENGCPPDGQAYNALIKLMTTRNMPDDAVRIYKKMIKNGFEPTIHTYNMMMKAYFLGVKNYAMGCAVWEEMLEKGICPDVNSYTVFVGGHIRHGRPEEAQKYMEEMINKGMKAPEINYNKFAADFSRAGKPDVLYEMAQKMNFSGKFDVANVFHGWAERMKNRVKRPIPYQTGKSIF